MFDYSHFKQDYSAYTAESFLVWKTLFQKLERIHQAYACSIYLKNKKQLGMCAEEIPHFDAINKELHLVNDWEVVAVNGILQPNEFLYLLSEKKFPVTPWIRPLEKAYFYDDADMLHDMLAHIPFLLDNRIASFLHEIGQLAIEAAFDLDAIEMISRVYWRTIEIGLIRENNTLKIYGAGLLSSLGASERSIKANVPRFNLTFENSVATPYFFDRPQDEYPVIVDFSILKVLVEKLQKTISTKVTI